jgi:hypothetical protein
MDYLYKKKDSICQQTIVSCKGDRLDQLVVEELLFAEYHREVDKKSDMSSDSFCQPEDA